MSQDGALPENFTGSNGADEGQLAADALWAEVGGRIRKKIGISSFNSWFRPLAIAPLHGDRVILIAATAFLRDWIRNNYQTLLLQEFRRDMPHVRDVVIELGVGRNLTSGLLARMRRTPPQTLPRRPRSRRQPPHPSA